MHAPFQPSNTHWYAETYQTVQTVNLSSSLQQAVTTAKVILSKVQIVAQDMFNQLQENIQKTQLEPIIFTINNLGNDIEKGFNIFACIPFVCFVSNSLRIIAGKLQVFAGALIAGVGELGLLVSTFSPNKSSDMINKWNTLSKLGTEHIIHGCLNVLRGTSENFLSSYTMGIGSIFLIIPNVSHHRDFQPYFAYGTLVNPTLAKTTQTETNNQNAPLNPADIHIEIQPIQSEAVKT